MDGGVGVVWFTWSCLWRYAISANDFLSVLFSLIFSSSLQTRFSLCESIILAPFVLLFPHIPFQNHCRFIDAVQPTRFAGGEKERLRNINEM